MALFTAPVRRIVVFLLGLALLGALWTTALTRLSDRDTAVPLLTDVGTQVLNPVLVNASSGLTQAAYGQLQQLAAAHPDQPLQIAGIRVPIQGSDIVGRSFADGSRVIYTKVAGAYYDGGGINASFALPPQVQQMVEHFNPFALATSAAQGTPAASLPQFPPAVLDLASHLGLSANTLTAAGHAGIARTANIFWALSALLALLLVVFSRGWTRLTNPAWSLFHAALPVSLLLAIIAFLVSRNGDKLTPFSNILSLLSGAFVPVYVGALVAGVVGIVLGKVAPLLLPHGSGALVREPAAPRAAYAAPPRQAPRQAPRQPDRAPSFGASALRDAGAMPPSPGYPEYPGVRGYGNNPGAPHYPDYPPASGYPQQSGYPQSDGYPPASGYPQSPAYPPTSAYPQMPGYSQADGYPTQSGYPQNDAYPPQQGYPQQGYSQQPGYRDRPRGPFDPTDPYDTTPP